MSKKAQAFHNVSEAINLDCRGLHQVAFGKYLHSLQMLSNLLVEQFCAVGCQIMVESYKKEARQILLVVSDCVERANLILSDDVKSRTNKNVSSSNEKIEALTNSSEKPVVPNVLLPGTSSVPLNQTVELSRFSYVEKTEKENALLFRKFQTRIANARDKNARANLQLELQRRLAENLAIAKSKYAQQLKIQQEEKKKVFEETARKISKIGPCFNDSDQERRNLYLQVLGFEANNSQHLNVEYEYSSLAPSEVAEKLLKRILQNCDHPLSQWLIMVQTKIKEKMSSIITEYSCFNEWLPERNPEVLQETTSAMTSSKNMSVICSSKQETAPIQERLDAIAQEIQNGIDTMLQIFCIAYKKELPSEADMMCYKFIEALVVSPVWPLFMTICRFANINSERRIVYTMHHCQKCSPDEFGVPTQVITKESELFQQAVIQLKRIPMLTSVMEKLGILVLVSRKLCGNPQEEQYIKSEKLLGADDLVPVLSYVLVHTSTPQLFSECRALELLVDPKYMLGEEGYSLTSFQAALNYLEMKIMIDVNDLESSSEKSSDESEKFSSNTINKP